MCLPLCSYYPNEHGVTSCQTSVRIDWLFQIYNCVVHFSPPLVVTVKLRVSSIPSILLIADTFFFQILIFIFMMKYFIWMGLYDRIQQSHDIQLYMYGCVSLLRHPVIPTAHYSDDPLFRQPIIPTAHYFDGPFFRQCKIELNPQIHGLARCIQQNGPSVRLILTDHGLRKGKGAFILGCTSPINAIMIDRPGMGKATNWKKSCAHCTKGPEKRSEWKKCEPVGAWERQNDGR
jgi:hypothetical protein